MISKAKELKITRLPTIIVQIINKLFKFENFGTSLISLNRVIQFSIYNNIENSSSIK